MNNGCQKFPESTNKDSVYNIIMKERTNEGTFDIFGS